MVGSHEEMTRHMCHPQDHDSEEVLNRVCDPTRTEEGEAFHSLSFAFETIHISQPIDLSILCALRSRCPFLMW